ncbi:MAG TPA: YrdB family protein [Gaiellaceae bacterium]|nr:YrdB family protein [Gaiellaceae bacterium]
MVRHRRPRTAPRSRQSHAAPRRLAGADGVLAELRGANLAVRFALELCLLAAYAYVGVQVNIVAAIVAPLAVAVVWGLFVSPKARFRIPRLLWIAAQVALFGGAAAGLVAVDHVVLGVLFAVAVALNLTLVLFWHQDDTVV